MGSGFLTRRIRGVRVVPVRYLVEGEEDSSVYWVGLDLIVGLVGVGRCRIRRLLAVDFVSGRGASLRSIQSVVSILVGDVVDLLVSVGYKVGLSLSVMGGVPLDGAGKVILLLTRGPLERVAV